MQIEIAIVNCSNPDSHEKLLTIAIYNLLLRKKIGGRLNYNWKKIVKNRNGLRSTEIDQKGRHQQWKAGAFARKLPGPSAKQEIWWSKGHQFDEIFDHHFLAQDQRTRWYKEVYDWAKGENLSIIKGAEKKLKPYEFLRDSVINNMKTAVRVSAFILWLRNAQDAHDKAIQSGNAGGNDLFAVEWMKVVYDSLYGQDGAVFAGFRQETKAIRVLAVI